MSNPHHCRIARVKLKSGGEIAVIPGSRGGDPDVAGLLLDVLKDVRSGYVKSVAIVTVAENGNVGTCWELGVGGNYHHLCSDVLTLSYRLAEP